MVAASVAMRWSLSGFWNNARFLESAAALSILTLIIGAVSEDWPKLKQIIFLTAKLIFFRSRAFERCVLKKHLVHSVGAIMVVLGIAGELIFETRTFIVEGRETAQLAVDAGKAKVSAQQAKVSAQTANDVLSVAQQRLAEVEGKSRELNRQLDAEGAQLRVTKSGLDETNSQLVAVEAKRAELEKSLTDMAVCNVPRIITGWLANGKSYVDPLRPFAGYQAIIEVVPEVEARRAAINIAVALSGAGWNRVGPLSPSMNISDGVTIKSYNGFGKSDSNESPLSNMVRSTNMVQLGKAAEAVRDFLHSYFWQADSAVAWSSETDIQPNGVKISVGLKPPVRL